MSEIIIKRPDVHAGISRVEFTETSEQNDKEPCVRLYSTMVHTAYNLQIRGTAPLGKNYRSNGNKPRNLIATISLDWESLVQIAAYVESEKKDRAKYVTEQEDYQIYPAEVIRQGLESNADEFNQVDKQAIASVLVQVELGNLKAAREIIDQGSETVHFYTIKPDEHGH